ncbi:hypothetical protein [Arthrobacter psychrochitiniphilus]|uniref:hypothetical protein n=1 Tax=Arthrobacter psychrochitiniphilus TaxID=291045 RepID=UPI003F7C12FF
MLIIVAAVCLGVLWWPPFLAPRWYRDWQAAGRRGRALPYSNEELRAADALPPGPKKQRLMADIGKSQHALWALKQADSARPKNV